MANIDISLTLGQEAQLAAQAAILERMAKTLQEINSLDEKQVNAEVRKEKTLSSQTALQKRLAEIEKEKERAGLAALKYFAAQEREAAKMVGKRINEEKAKERVRKEQDRYNQKLKEQNSIVGSINTQINRQKQLVREATSISQIEKANRELIKLKNQLREVSMAGVEIQKKGSFFSSIFGASFAGNIVSNLASQAFSQVKEFGERIVDLTAKREDAIIKLTQAFRGNEVRAKETVNLIEDFALRANVSIEELTAGTLRLANRGLRPTKELLTQVGDLANALSTRADGFTQVVEAILDAEQGQFRRLEELGIGINASTLKSSNKIIATFKDQQTVIENTGSAIKEYILGLSQLDSIQGITAKSAEGLAGKIEQSSDAIDNLLRALGESKKGVIKDFFDAFSDGVQRITRDVRGLNEIEEKLTKLNIDPQKLPFAVRGQVAINLQKVTTPGSDDFNQVVDLTESIRAVLENEKRSIFQRIGDINDLREEIAGNRTLNEIQKAILQLAISEADQSLADQIRARFEDANKFKTPEYKAEKKTKEDLSALRAQKELFGSIKAINGEYGQRIALVDKLVGLQEKLNGELSKPEASQNVEYIRELRGEIERLKDAVKIDTTPIEKLFERIRKQAESGNPAGSGFTAGITDLASLDTRGSFTTKPKGLDQYADLITGTILNELPKYQEQFSQFIDFLDRKAEEKSQRQLDRLDRETDKQKSAVDTQRELAARGLENTLAFELERQQKLEALKAREEQRTRRRAQRYAAMQALLNTLGNIANTTSSGQSINYGQLFAGLGSSIGFFEQGGIVGQATQYRSVGGQIVQGMAQGRRHSQGGILTEIEAGEGVLSRKQMSNLGYENFMYLRESLDKGPYSELLGNSATSFIAVVEKNTSNTDARLLEEVQGLREELRNIKTTDISVDALGNLVEKVVEKGKVKTTTYIQPNSKPKKW